MAGDDINGDESPQRELADRSDPAYRKSATKRWNPPNGSWGIVQIQPTKGVPSKPWNPPNGELGDCSDPALHRTKCAVLFSVHARHTVQKPGLGLPASLLSL
jgi:hypothetical protein